MRKISGRTRGAFWSIGSCLLVLMSTSSARVSEEVEERSRIAAGSLEDAIVVDCQLPGKLQKLGGQRTYMTPGTLRRLSAVDCRARGGEYTLGDLSSGTLSLKRWLPLAEQGQAEAQYYVARIYANGMSGVSTDYTKAAQWYQLAAKQNYSSAIQELGYMYEQGLGVPQDTKMALNLQRQAAGLGDELDYSWKITAAKEEAAQRIAALSEQLDASNTQLDSLRGELEDTNNAVFRSRAQLAKAETAMLDLREQLQAAKNSGGGDSNKVKELNAALATREETLRVAQAQTQQLTAKLQEQQSQLASQLASSQTSSSGLSEMLAQEQANNRSLSARAVQAEQRLISSQQELGAVRTRYRSEVEQLLADREALERATAQTKDNAAATVLARERELAKQLLRVSALESETGELRNEVNRLRDMREKDSQSLVSEASRARESLRLAQSKLNEQRERLERMQMEKATEMAALAKARDQLQRELAANKKANEMQVAFLAKDLDLRSKDLEAKSAEIDRLETRLEEQSKTFSAMAKSVPQPKLASNAAASEPKMRSADSRLDPMRASLSEFRSLTPGKDHALIIGNSNYRNYESLDTPSNDAREVAELLQQRYGFDVQLLIDATRDQIMTALHQQKLNLGEADNLLIYYAGHGAVDGSPERAFWLGVEANPDTRAGWLEADHIRAKIKDMSAKHVLLVADSCFSGAITHPKTTTIGRQLNETRLRVQWNRKARMVLTSGEITPVADSAGDRNHSLFARYFLQVLRQNVNVMSGEMLSYALSERMLREPVPVGKNGQEQRPTYSTLQDANHDVGDFFFVPTAEPAKVAGVY
ncbi:MAG: caspase family protein [Steroidobacteraceae bacterium]